MIRHREVDLLVNYPRANRDLAARAKKTKYDVLVARRFGRDFFDGARRHGYGGFTYDPKWWGPVIPDFIARYGDVRSVLDVGCAKGFMLHEFRKHLSPGAKLAGIDISGYAIAKAMPRLCVQVGDAKKLPYPDSSFELVVSINTLHNLERDDCLAALAEIERVSARYAYVTLDAYRTREEEHRVRDWNLTARTILHVDEWKKLFAEAGYSGDYGWFCP